MNSLVTKLRSGKGRMQSRVLEGQRATPRCRQGSHGEGGLWHSAQHLWQSTTQTASHRLPGDPREAGQRGRS